jgi:hypothetical protein
MRLKTAISIIETSYGALGLIALVGTGACFFTLTGENRVFAIVLLLALLIVAFFVKLNLINLYLKRCKYPYEFLSVLEQLDLTKDIQINWGEDLIDGPKKNQLLTQQFLEDNNLATEIGVKKINLPFAIILIGVSVISLLYFSQKVSINDKPIVFISLLLLLSTGFYLWIKGKKQKNDIEPILFFKDKGLLVYGSLYEWNKIKSWIHKGGGENSNGEMIITYEILNGEEETLKADLNKFNVDRIDFMLLLTHFKAKYG